jgi:predicted metal-dependent phosphoesterase TrpH
VIIGEEIMTNQGEILAAFVEEVVPPFLSAEETIARLREQGAFISVSHPFDPLREGGWKENDLQAIADKVDAIETFNARCFFPWYNWRAERFAKAHNLPGTHGSDAHTPGEVGAGTILLPPFEDADGLREAIQHAVSPPLRLLMPWVHFSSSYAKWVKRRRKSK